MPLEHVSIEDRATVVMALQAHRQGLEIARKDSGPIRIIGARVSNLKKEIKRADAMINTFTNKWIYVSDDLLDPSQLYKKDLVHTPEWATALREIYALTVRAVVYVDTKDGAVQDHAATEQLHRLMFELTAGGTL